MAISQSPEHDLDVANRRYFDILSRRFRAQSGSTGNGPTSAGSDSGAAIRLAEGTEATGNHPGAALAFPTAIAPDDLLKSLPLTEYSALAARAAEWAADARRAHVWLAPLQAGTGSSLTRSTYLAQRSGGEIGAKGTDLRVRLAGDREVPLGELQILRALREFRRGAYAGLAFQDLVSFETEASIERIWQSPSVDDPARTYAQVFAETAGLERFARVSQAHLPTIDEQGELTTRRRAPGGHAFFFLNAVQSAWRDDDRPRARDGQALICAISNGEDLNSAPDPAIIGWMAKERIPLALVTTEKTPLDAKGGMLSLVRDPSGEVYLTVFETAQAQALGQADVFEKMGLTIRREGRAALISTNLTLINFEALAPILRELRAELGEERLLDEIAPKLILNAKQQTDTDGVSRRYVQLEGAMGSSLMNLDRLWRRRTGKPLVHLVNVDAERRTDFFSPVKSAFDFFMLFHSDHFALDARTLRLANLRPGSLPTVILKDPATGDKFYQDVQNVLDSFAGARLRDLDRLEIRGQVRLRGAHLSGDVRIFNRGGALVDAAPRVRAAREDLRRNGMAETAHLTIDIGEAG